MTDVLRRPTLVHHLAGHVRTQPDVPCVFFRRQGVIVSRTWSEFGRDVVRMATALVSLGAKAGDRVALASPNRYEWLVADMAILGLGAVNVPLHASLTGPQMRFQIVDSESTILIVSGDEQLDKLKTAEPAPNSLRVVAFEATKEAGSEAVAPDWTEQAAVPTAGGIATWCDRAAAERRSDELATILYTSGTTGEPKGVMLTHGNLESNAAGVVVGFHGPAGAPAVRDRRMNLLPLSHIYARTCDFYCWLVAGSELALADTPLTAVADSGEMRPTLFNAVPYFYERLTRRLTELGVADMPGALGKMLGGRVRHCCSGGAPLPDHVAKFFVDRGVLLTQGYGLTESSPVITMNTPHVFKHGTVGRAVPGVEVRIAADGEVLTRGPHVMLGYWNRPQETAAAIVDGWLHTGDLGELDADGYLKITGRKKELIVTSGGKKVVPAAVESLLGQDPLVKQAVVVGDGRKCLTALVVPDLEKLAKSMTEAGLSIEIEKMCGDPRVAEFVRARLAERLKQLSHYEQVQRVALVEREFSIDRGEVTLKLTYRRGEIAKNYADVIERMYEDLHIPTS